MPREGQALLMLALVAAFGVLFYVCYQSVSLSCYLNTGLNYNTTNRLFVNEANQNYVTKSTEQLLLK
jgi:hypothetical protein